MSPEPPPHNLPLQLTSFIGREREIAEVKRLLGTSRLLTLTGAGGSGKTRLALQVASQVVGDYPDGVFFIDLAPITDPSLVLPSVAKSLAVKVAPGEALIETLKSYLQGKEVLFLLDNFEQVVAAAPLIVDLLVSASDLKILVTSREPLHVQGEQLYQVPPLELPDPARQASVEELSQTEAVALFIERARLVQPDFRLLEVTAPVVAQICSRLDGLPLAIELAAARSSVLTPQAMLLRLDTRLKLLTKGAHDLPARHQTLRSAIEWSYDLLTEDEKQLFRRMAVFQGGRTLEALEAVANFDGKLRVDALEGVQSLVDKSLLQQRVAKNGEPRFVMLETIHEYAKEKLQHSGEAVALQGEHALYFMRLAEEAEPHLRGAKQQEWLDRLDDEHDNIRAALRWATEQGAVGNASATEVGLRMAASLWRLWDIRAYHSEGREQLVRFLSASQGQEEVVEIIATTEAKAIRAKALNGAGNLAFSQGDYKAARSLHTEALTIRRELGDKLGIAGSQNNLANTVTRLGDYTTARELYEETLAIMTQLGDKHGIAMSLHNLGSVAFAQGDYQRHHALKEESLAISRELGDKFGIAIALENLGNEALYEEVNPPRARELYEESLRIFGELGNQLRVALSLNNLGRVAFFEGEYARARQLSEMSLEMLEEIGSKPGMPWALDSLGLTALQEGDVEHARLLFTRSLQIDRTLGDKRRIPMDLLHLGAVAAAKGEVQKAARLLGASEALGKATATTLNRSYGMEYEGAMALVRLQLGEQASEQAKEAGRAMSVEQAIAYALETVPERQPAASARTVPDTAVKSKPSSPNELSRREVEVLRLLGEGLRNQQIAERLFLSDNTVRAHLYSIYSKLGVTNRTAAVRFVQEYQAMQV